MPQWDNCDPITVSIVPGECSVSVVPSVQECEDGPSIVFGECGPSAVPVEIVISVAPPERGPTPYRVDEVSVPPIFLPPPPELPVFELSSKPYAYELMDRMVSRGSDLRQGPTGEAEDFITSAAVIFQGTLRDPLRSYIVPPEDFIESGALVISGTLRQAILSYVAPPEDIVASGALMLNGGTLQVVLITYVHPPQDITASGGTILGGSLI